MNTNRSMPPRVIIPEIPYADINQAADWLCRAFGFKKRLQIGNHRFQLTFGDNSVVAVEGNASNPSFSIMVHVEDLDRIYEQAKSMGARIINPPADYPFGERQCTVEDIGGHRWTFSQTVADVDPASWGGILFEVSS
ncbi:MAG: VOC family protein [Byssovorax cruenta]